MPKALQLYFSDHRDEYRIRGREAPVGEPFRLETVGEVSLASLRSAMAGYTRRFPRFGRFQVPGESAIEVRPAPAEEQWCVVDLSASGEDVDEDEAVPELSSFVWQFPDTLLLDVMVYPGPVEEGERPDIEAVENVVAPFVERHGAVLFDVAYAPAERGSAPYVSVLVEPQIRGRRIRDAMALGDEIFRLASATLSRGPFGPRLTIDLVGAGRADLLIGHIEGDWLEAKRALPHIKSNSDRMELAKDVSALANAEGGVVVFGLGTKRTPGGDRISSAHPFHPSEFRSSAYRRALDRDIFPPIEGLRIDLGRRSESEAFGLIAVPRQPEELKPFFVRGAVVGGKHLGAHVSVYERRGDGALAYSPERIHSLAAAGRAALRVSVDERHPDVAGGVAGPAVAED